MNANEIRRLANAINAHRPDWPISSLTTFLTRSLANRTYQDASVALTWVATDAKPDGTPASDKPSRVLEAGPWWKVAEMAGRGATVAHAPKLSETCQVPGHEGYRADPCAGCNADRLAGDPAPTRHDTSGTDHSAHAASIRASLASGAAGGEGA